MRARGRGGPARTAFREPLSRPDPDVSGVLPSRRQSIALLAVLVVVAGVISAVSLAVRPDRSRAFDLVHGSVFLADQLAPVGVDLASGRPTVRLVGADKQVGVTGAQQLSVVPLHDGTLLLNATTGEFNMIDQAGFLIKHDGSGVPLPGTTGKTAAVGVASGSAAFIERTGPDGTDVVLVDQATTAAAAVGTGAVRPRAGVTTPLTGSTRAGAAVAANGHLWLLLGAHGSDGETGARTVRELTVPAGSAEGATLRATDHGKVSGPAAITAGGPPGRQSVAVASAAGIRVTTPGGHTTAATFAVPAGLDRVLPVSGVVGDNQLAFLIHATDGWSIVSVPWSGGRVHGPSTLRGVTAQADLAPPVTAGGLLWTADRESGAIYRIDQDGVGEQEPGATTYPLARSHGRLAETADFADVYLITSEGRVFVDSPSHVDALALFTDGSRRPQVIEKSTAIAVNAAGSAEALARTSALGTTAPRGTAPAPAVQNPVDNQVDCAAVKQRPHVPVITQATPGARSVALAWTYPLLDPQDCAPSTYVVTTHLSAGQHAPEPPQTTVVQGQTGVDLTGLYPSTRYEVTVTAYLHGVGTASAPVQVNTGPEGPGAPTGIEVTSTSSGQWQVSWSSCGTVGQGCVPAASWQVVPSYCDGEGLSATPDPVNVPADPTTRRQAPITYGGSDALLGRGLSFRVEGLSGQGTTGEPSAASSCTYSWRAPDASALSLLASVSPVRSFGGTTSATVRLDAGADPVRNLGGTGAQITYQLLSGAHTVASIGPTTRTTVTFGRLAAARQYQARAVVTPPHRSSPQAVVGPIAVQVAESPWPAIDVRASASDISGDPVDARLSLSIGGLSSAAARGELFRFANTAVTCGNTTVPLGADNNPSAFDPSNTQSFTVSRTVLNGPCTVRVQLEQDPGHSTDPPLFGAGTTSGTATDGVTIDTPDYTASSNDFAAVWAGTSTDGRSQVAVTDNDHLSQQQGNNWHVSISEHGNSCGSYAGNAFPGDIPVAQTCVDDDPQGADWTVTVSFDYFGANSPSYTMNVDGGLAPSTQKCDVDGNLDATYGATLAQGVSVTISGSAGIGGCSGWTYELDDRTGARVCQNATDAEQGNSPSATFDLSGCGDTPQPDWTLTVGWKDATGSSPASSPETVPITGDPPQN